MDIKNYILYIFLCVISTLVHSQRIDDLPAELERQKADKANCLSNLESNSRIKLLEPKLPFNGFESPPIEVLGNPTKPTQKEKSAISYLASERDRCNQMDTEWRRQNIPNEYSEVFDTYWRETKFILADLYGGKITYGDVAKARSKLSHDWATKINAINLASKEKDELAIRQREQAEALRQEETARLLAQYQRQLEADSQKSRLAIQQLEQQQAQLQLMQKQADAAQRQANFNDSLKLLQLGAPRTAPAPAFNNSINCRTTYYGNVATTNCN